MIEDRDQSIRNKDQLIREKAMTKKLGDQLINEKAMTKKLGDQLINEKEKEINRLENELMRVEGLLTSRGILEKYIDTVAIDLRCRKDFTKSEVARLLDDKYNEVFVLKNSSIGNLDGFML